MRKYILILLTSVLLLNLYGFYISFYLHHERVRSEIQQQLAENKQPQKLQQFSFTFPEYELLKMYEQGKEFSLNGAMYDIVKKEFKDGQIILSVLYDHQETGLLAQLVSMFEEESRPNNEKRSFPVFSLLEFIFQDSQWKCFYILTCLSLCSSPYEFLSQLSVDLVSPPPDSAFS